MTLRARLTLGLLTIAVILIVPLLSALRSLDRVHEEAKMLRDGDFAASLIVGRLRESLNDLRAAELALLFVRDEKSHKAMRERILDVQRMADSLAAYGLDRASVEVRAGMGDVAANEEAEFNAASSGRASEAEQISSQKIIPAIARAEAAVGVAERELRERTRDRVAHAASHASQGTRATVIGLLLAVVVAALLAFRLTQSVSRPVHELERGMRRVADGDFSAKLAISPSRTDEFGRLASSFEEMSQRLAALDKIKAEFVSVASHELKTPINVILGYTQLLQEELYGPLTAKQRGVADVLEKQSKTLARLVKQLLDVTRFEAGGGKLEVRDVELRGFLQNLEDAFRVLADQRGVRFRVAVADELPQVVHWDPDRINEVLGNLLSNAFKFTERGGEVELSVHSGENSIHMDVRDTGAGIPADQVPHIFEKFFQADNQNAASQAGSGLGLAIARQIVEAHKGSIHCESTEGVGTTFSIDLPVQATGGRISMQRPAMVET